MLWAFARSGLACATLSSLVACGQKGPPLAPLHLVPSAVSELSVRRVADTVRLRFVLPSSNANGPGPVDLDRVEIYAMTVAPGAPPPPNRELLTRTYLVGTVAVRPIPVEGAAPEEGDVRPEPGAAVSFDEVLDAAKMTPVPAKAPPTPIAAPVPAPAQPSLPPEPKHPQRIYTVRGVTRSGRFGAPSPRVDVFLVPIPSAPVDVTSRFTESAVVIDWTAPAEPPLPTSYNVYRADDPMQPINLSPVAAAPFEFTGARFGESSCFRVRGIVVTGTVATEGPLSDETCVTPQDIFPPAAPTRLDAVPTPGQISLIWEANTEKDLAGYLVLRGEAPDGALQAITPAPIRESSYRDATVKPGVRYIYAVVAVDTARPPNTSAQSPRVEETAR